MNEEMSDHDILIKNTVQIENLHEKIDTFLSIINNKADDAYFKWFVGIVFMVLISISGTIWQTNNSVADVKNKLVIHDQIFLKK